MRCSDVFVIKGKYRDIVLEEAGKSQREVPGAFSLDANTL
ncbi:MAG: hypothetical protein DDT25_00932 [Chloroflexi bacterium]|nr:hypothetical protein [Chloroflexota bacterium]